MATDQSSQKSTIVWFKQDLRIIDNPALLDACKRGAVLPLYIFSPDEDMGAASKWWLHHSLESLRDELRQIGLQLIVRMGKPKNVLDQMIKASAADAVYWNRCYEPRAIAEMKSVKEWLHARNIEARSFNAALLYEPWTIANKQGKPFQVFTPFWKACRASGKPSAPLGAPKHATMVNCKLSSDESIASLKLLPKIHWDDGLKESWNPGTKGANVLLAKFLKGKILEYKQSRDFPSVPGVSHLSPHLHFGEISSRMIWHQVCQHYNGDEEGVECYLRQLGWREFAYHLLYHFPHTPDSPLREDFNLFPWKSDPVALQAWCHGKTGYPFVDAGMRELWHTGWMHNRVRMVVGSFLVKDLLISWVHGAKWFWDTLVDADLANNTLGWQWVGGCGADAAPYFRIFNPCTQGEKFDPDGHYVRKWVPELAMLPNKWIHRPWEAPEDVLVKAGVTLGATYPSPIVDHNEARHMALAAFSSRSKK